MKNLIRITLACCISLGAGAVIADTQTIDAMVYAVEISANQDIEAPNGHTVNAGGLTHGTIINSNGDKSSQWCRGATVADGDAFIGGAGFCSIVNDSGDYLWIWWRPSGPGTNDWGVIGGSGAWAGATGGGVNTITTQFPDGRAWISHSEGTITTP